MVSSGYPKPSYRYELCIDLLQAALERAPAQLLLCIYGGGSDEAYMASLRRRAEGLWARRFPLLFWGSAVLFGLVHAFNWELGGRGWRAVALVPLLVLPQTGLGLVLGAARVRLGYLGAVLLHASYNATILALTLL